MSLGKTPAPREASTAPAQSGRASISTRTVWIVVGVTLTIGAGSLALVSPAAGKPTHLLVGYDDVIQGLAAYFGGACCFFTAAKGSRRLRSTWFLMGVSTTLWGLGETAWCYQELILRIPPANLFPSWPDLGFLSSVPFGIASLL